MRLNLQHLLLFTSILLLSTVRANPPSPSQPLPQQPAQVTTWMELAGYYLSIVLLLALAALCSGLTVGYTSFDRIELELIKKNGSEEDKGRIMAIEPIIHQHHILLSTLLIANAFAMEALPLAVNKVAGETASILLSTVGLLIFGEVVPQAFCTGEHQLEIACAMAPIVKGMICLLYPLVKPIGWALDRMLGQHEEKKRYDQDDLISILKLHKKKELGYSPQQIDMMVSTLKLKATTAQQAMIPLAKVVCVALGTILSKKVVYSIAKAAYSKIPLFQDKPNNLKGYVVLKQLIDYREEGVDNRIEQFCTVRPAVTIDGKAHLLQVMDIFKRKKTKMLFVRMEEQVVGVLTLKQVFEHITLKKFTDQDVHQTELLQK